MRINFVFGLIFLIASSPLFCQVRPSATNGGQPPLSLGGGISRINPDFGHGTIYGGTLWLDYSLSRRLPFLRGIGIEIEARDLHLDDSPKEPVLREDVALGGVTYTLNRFRNVKPYGKLESGLGNIDYMASKTRVYHQSRTVTGFGGGLEYRAFRTVWVRMDYESQYFPDFFLGTPAKPTSAPIDPQGFTLGAMYHFGHGHSTH